MKPIEIRVDGKPQPAGSKRAFVIRKCGVYTGRAIVTDANPKSRDWKIDVQYAARAVYMGPALRGPIFLRLDFRVDRPKSHYGLGKNAFTLKANAPKHPTSKPDATKLCRGVEDALTHIIWADDSQIVSQVISKSYGIAGVTIYIEEWTQ